MIPLAAPTLSPREGGPGHAAQTTRWKVWMGPTSLTRLRPALGGEGHLPSRPFLCGLHQEGRRSSDALAGREGTLWLLPALDPGYPHCAYQKGHTESSHRAYTCPQDSLHRMCMRVHRAHTGYTNACTHTKGSQRLYMCARTYLPLCICAHVCTYTERSHGGHVSV